MDTNIPNPDELEQTALRIYFVAFHQVLNIIDDLLNKHQLLRAKLDGRSIVAISDAENSRTTEDNSDDIAEYIRLAQPDLQLSYTLIQQSQELGLKSIICRESPFLLLLGSDVRSWGHDKDFADLRTIDAGDLIKVVNAIKPNKLDEKFSNTFNALRRGRNKISHLGQFRDQIDPIYLLDILIDQYRSLYTDRTWIQDLLLFESSHRHTIFTSAHLSDQNSALSTYASVEDATTLAQQKFLLGASKNCKLYRCPKCHSGDYMGLEMGIGRTLAVERRSTKASCLICLEEFSIKYRQCIFCRERVAFIDRGGDEDMCGYCGEKWRDHQP
ncbi:MULTISPECIES: hypothetical protein [unclassified Methylobacterium]|uniref:hypothetical protein n=1 Tax=unclassified Methylobacterium TaxID=2615210 RepID=UPI0011C1EF14|nr:MULTISPECIES: hypothetical protein [unclassified Methylobacterium]QEE37976.1 hypothetical protein FVA80_02325 [Methylobacterium sp. WL1]TXN59816.1 hypothetical protein FV241_00155 [Methylobacterium sp. WL2]